MQAKNQLHIGDGIVNPTTKFSATIIEVYDDGYLYVYDFDTDGETEIDSRNSEDPYLLTWSKEL